MTRDDILRMAREVADKDRVDPVSGPPGEEFVTMTPEELERFAALVAAAEREEAMEAILVECPIDGSDEELILRRAWDRVRTMHHDAIRARGTK